MTTPSGKQRVLSWYDAFNEQDPAALDEILDEDWIDTPAAPGQPHGAAGAKAVLAMLTSTFPDLRVTVHEVLQDGDKVVVRSTITGTQRGPFMGAPATGRTLEIMAVDIHQLRGDRIVHTWHVEDWMTGFAQLGIVGH